MKHIELRHFYYTNSDLLYLIYPHRFSGARLAFGDQGIFQARLFSTKLQWRLMAQVKTSFYFCG